MVVGVVVGDGGGGAVVVVVVVVVFVVVVFVVVVAVVVGGGDVVLGDVVVGDVVVHCYCCMAVFVWVLLQERFGAPLASHGRSDILLVAVCSEAMPVLIFFDGPKCWFVMDLYTINKKNNNDHSDDDAWSSSVGNWKWIPSSIGALSGHSA